MLEFDEIKLTLEGMESGIKELKLTRQNGKIGAVEVNMGKADLAPKSIPVNLDGDKIINREVEVAGGKYSISAVSVGNPHCIVFVDNVDKLNIEELGPKFENDPIFPERINTEFVKIVGENTIKMRVWERGNGETWGCGTGACAAAVAACEMGLCSKDADITIKLIGGDLVIRYTSDGTVYLKGDAVKSFEGTVTIE